MLVYHCSVKVIKFTIAVFQRCYHKKDVLKIGSKFTGEHTYSSVILIKFCSNFIEITLQHWRSTVNLLHIFRAALKDYFQIFRAPQSPPEHPWRTLEDYFQMQGVAILKLSLFVTAYDFFQQNTDHISLDMSCILISPRMIFSLEFLTKLNITAPEQLGTIKSGPYFVAGL